MKALISVATLLVLTAVVAGGLAHSSQDKTVNGVPPEAKKTATDDATIRALIKQAVS